MAKIFPAKSDCPFTEGPYVSYRGSAENGSAHRKDNRDLGSGRHYRAGVSRWRPDGTGASATGVCGAACGICAADVGSLGHGARTRAFDGRFCPVPCVPANRLSRRLPDRGSVSEQAIAVTTAETGETGFPRKQFLAEVAPAASARPDTVSQSRISRPALCGAMS